MKLIVTTSRPLTAEKSAAVLKSLTDFLGLEPSDVLVLPDGVCLHALDCGRAGKAGEKPADKAGDGDETTERPSRGAPHHAKK